MKILLTGATGYIGKRLLPVLIEQGHAVVCCVRDKNRFPSDGIYSHPNVSVFEVDFLKEISISDLVKDIDAAYYLIHSMSSNVKDFGSLEETSANNFIKLVKQTSVKQIIYLGGITNEEKLSKHLASRKRVEEMLSKSGIPLTSIKAGIIVGSGSASFEIIRDLVEKLPVMITPKWLNTRHQPIAIRNILEYLTGVLLKPETFNKSFDVGGPDVLSYKEMLLQFAEVRGLKRFIFTVPVMTPRLSSYWLYFVTSTSYLLAINLVNSMKVEVVAKDNELEKMLGIKPISYKEAVQLAFQKIEQNNVISSWKDSLISSYSNNSLLKHINIPINGCFIDKKEKEITTSIEQVLDNIWSIGGERGWYYGDWLWYLRGFLDKLVGGVGLRRGRTNKTEIHTGDTLDFWRVLAADKQNKRLLLYAEMKLPGEAWLEFKVIKKNGKNFLQQTATFRPKGLLGRLYWYSVLPFHFFVFDGMAEKVVGYENWKY
ncbi:Putative nucleoside-diphosphate sugar epimerase [Ignavibacterium album JCM 16511]|uniref:Putative nucleoside-diphosphate sugar epimerase n=1 Tax=Ignavibacterium album (strain DSM 19864 / JCM 16511 / NBRC 101810 / Mat9-16) TaxID=945713 RepID=I0AFM2_IGNAJ|nr:SDR family oxidoreductase [Ignavibacterium album]AFH47779.1 Putative nucleoside-diphosphate sugar epimerase [Ignavibacterium album JCM 16511]